MAINYPQRYDDDFLNTIKTVIDHVNVHGKTIQDLVAEGQLTEEQYAELITVINGHLKSGEVDVHDFNSTTKEYIQNIENRISAVISGLSGDEEFYTPIGLENYMTTHNESWVI